MRFNFSCVLLDYFMGDYISRIDDNRAMSSLLFAKFRIALVAINRTIEHKIKSGCVELLKRWARINFQPTLVECGYNIEVT